MIRKTIRFFLAIYIILSLVHLSYMMACYDVAKPMDWIYFSVYGLSALVYKVVKNY